MEMTGLFNSFLGVSCRDEHIQGIYERVFNWKKVLSFSLQVIEYIAFYFTDEQFACTTQLVSCLAHFQPVLCSIYVSR